MATTPQQQEDDDDEMDPIKIPLPDHEEIKIGDANVLNISLRDGARKQEVLDRHYLRSIDSMVVIRQLPSQGLSFQLWSAANTLVTLLDNHNRCQSSTATTSPLAPILAPLLLSKCDGNVPLNMLELGSGTGLVGIAAAVALRANVTVTDLPHVIPNLQFNVDANADLLALHGGAVHVAPLRWGEEGDVEILGRDFDLVLASDVVYHDELYEPLLKTLRTLMLDEDNNKKKKKMVFVMAHLRRWKKESRFFKKAKKLFDVDIVYVESPCEGSRVGVVVYRFVEKGQILLLDHCRARK